MQRKIINELKNNFHEIKTQINDNPNGFAYCWEKLDKMTNDISHLFSEFEVNMDASKYEDAASIAEKISNGISKLDEVVTQLPELIDIAKNKLPDSINSLANNFQLCLNDGVFLQHLNFDGFASAIYSILEVNLKKIKECDLVDVNERLTDCQVRLNQFQRELDQEKVAYRDLKKTDNNCATMLNNISNIINDITDKNSDSFIRYGLDELNSSYNDLMTDYTNCYDNYRSLKSSLDSNSIPATTLIITYLDLEKEISELSKSFTSTSNKLNDTNIAEQRSRDLLNRFTVVLNESKASIRLSQLPGISSQYNKDINDAEQYIIQINDLLTNDVVDINELTRVTNEANNLISSLLKNVNMLISAAQEIEKLIVTCNKYRPYYPKLDAALYSAEFSYRNGVYTKACNIATEALREINPSLAKSLALKINNLLNPRKEG